MYLFDVFRFLTRHKIFLYSITNVIESLIYSKIVEVRSEQTHFISSQFVKPNSFRPSNFQV